MNILIVKLSSLGDVVHAMPAVQDIRAAWPQARIDWVVERGFAPLVQRCAGVQRVIACELRRWRHAPLATDTRAQWRAFRRELGAQPYDAVIDLQGLTKSALVAWLAPLAPGGRRYAMANQTEGSGYEAPTRWVADVAVPIEPHIHAVQRSRELCARALGHRPLQPLRYGLGTAAAVGTGEVVFVHGTSRDDKLWPEAHWIALGQRLVQAGHRIGLPHGSEAERARSERLAAALGPAAQVWPRLDLGTLTDRLAASTGVIGVDSGLSHIAVALDRPHVQIYNFDTAWRTGPDAEDGAADGAAGTQGTVGATGPARQCSVFAQPTPAVDAVWQAWQRVAGA